MPTLGNHQHEKFCQEAHRLIWSGTKRKIALTDAYIAAGYQADQKFVSDNARKLANRTDVKARLAELSNFAATMAGIDAGWAQMKLKALVDSNLDDYLAPPDAQGVRRFDISKVSREKLGLILELTQEEEHKLVSETGDEDDKTWIRINKIKIKRSDPIQALALMAKIAGWLAPEKQEHSGGLTLESLVSQSFAKPAPALPEPAKTEPA